MSFRIDYCKCARSSISELEAYGVWIVCEKCHKLVRNPFESNSVEEGHVANDKAV